MLLKKPTAAAGISKPRRGRVLAIRWVSVALVVAGVVGLLSQYWPMIAGDAIVGGMQSDRAHSFHFGNPQGADAKYPLNPQKEGEVFARMTVPRFGKDWARLIGQGTRWHPTLNEIGVGHFRGTALPGGVGNFAVAAHRGGFGGTFRDIDKLGPGDKVYVETRDAIYTYVYMQTKIVKPSDIGVVAPVPAELIGAVAGGHYMTMTSCYPIWVDSHRIVVWLSLGGVEYKHR
ncbi:MAG: class E sortase [Micrococcales bacterium]